MSNTLIITKSTGRVHKSIPLKNLHHFMKLNGRVPEHKRSKIEEVDENGKHVRMHETTARFEATDKVAEANNKVTEMAAAMEKMKEENKALKAAAKEKKTDK